MKIFRQKDCAGRPNIFKRKEPRVLAKRRWGRIAYRKKKVFEKRKKGGLDDSIKGGEDYKPLSQE